MTSEAVRDSLREQTLAKLHKSNAFGKTPGLGQGLQRHVDHDSPSFAVAPNVDVSKPTFFEELALVLQMLAQTISQAEDTAAELRSRSLGLWPQEAQGAETNRRHLWDIARRPSKRSAASSSTLSASPTICGC